MIFSNNYTTHLFWYYFSFPLPIPCSLGSFPWVNLFSPAYNTLENVGATNSGDVSSAIEKNFDKIGDEVNALIADVDDLRKTVTAIIDDLQELGLVG